MKLHYYPETDSLYIELKSAPGAEAREIVAGLVVDRDSTSTMPPASSTCPKSRRSPFRRRAPRSDAPFRVPGAAQHLKGVHARLRGLW